MIIIPARLNSSRFANKILADIFGLPMVVRTAKQVSSLDKVVIATDSSEVMELAKEYGFDAVMTSIEHNSGTDRINEAVNNLNLDDDEIIVNVQADEPFIETSVVEAVINRVKEVQSCPNTLITSCYKTIKNDSANDPNLVKVVLNNLDEAIYFSRAKIPYNRDNIENMDYFGHLGIYGFTKSSLNKFCSLNPSKLENIEKLEQLRAIDNGYKIAMVKVESKSFGIDTKEDLQRALEVFKDEK
ncbi:3-deoxy-manno-octulosonate cytidylyltransferase [Arcobacter vandammei]|uniref:3-deoxy-manno-octulosonate cytidylyltransferase n=1 Tax=Arcobacter vandammei TaxID=2782243 RepID=UPI0018DFA11E|nr:3-deoxy-manno-octulosonate cytidylyltransferase [Arcobacter vandammei]